MIYGTNNARQTAIENISNLYIKLAETKPTDELPYSDIMSIMYYLETLKDELKREIKKNG